MTNWSNNAKIILGSRYLLKDRHGNTVEDCNDILSRVSKHVSSIEKNDTEKEFWNKKFLSIMETLEFLPNSPTLMNAGKENAQLSACFLLVVQDSMVEIFETIKQTALIHKSGGGSGLVFSHLRPKNSVVRSTHGVASGVVSFMRVFDAATEAVKQGGVRRGANIGILNIQHPDIEEFILCKSVIGRFENFNISASVTDNFMKAVKADVQYPLLNPFTKEKIYISAKNLFNLLCQQSWATGDPGVIFIDTINSKNPCPWLGPIEGVNPCGENPLLNNESCNLGSIDASKFVVNKKFDWDRFGDVVEIATRFLDNVIDVNNYPNVKIERRTKLTRKIGLGIMGFADGLIKLGLKYNSDGALKFARKLSASMQGQALITSRELAKEKGACPAFLMSGAGMKKNKSLKRNSTLTTLAPTGTLSILADCSSGIEPLFSKNYTKTVLNGTKLVFNNKFGEVNPELLVTAHEITPEWHIKMQAAFQENIDNAVSKTVNLPNSATVEDIKNGIFLAHSMGCKGITFFRDGVRTQPLENSPEGEILSECQNGRCPI